jgi:hypothetical protein
VTVFLYPVPGIRGALADKKTARQLKLLCRSDYYVFVSGRGNPLDKGDVSGSNLNFIYGLIQD